MSNKKLVDFENLKSHDFENVSNHLNSKLYRISWLFKCNQSTDQLTRKCKQSFDYIADFENVNNLLTLKTYQLSIPYITIKNWKTFHACLFRKIIFGEKISMSFWTELKFLTKCAVVDWILLFFARAGDVDLTFLLLKWLHSGRWTQKKTDDDCIVR